MFFDVTERGEAVRVPAAGGVRGRARGAVGPAQARGRPARARRRRIHDRPTEPHPHAQEC